MLRKINRALKLDIITQKQYDAMYIDVMGVPDEYIDNLLANIVHFLGGAI